MTRASKGKAETVYSWLCGSIDTYNVPFDMVVDKSGLIDSGCNM